MAIGSPNLRVAQAALLSLLTIGSLSLSSPARAGAPKEMSLPKKLEKKLKSFEPSAALYLPESGQYLIASDDTTEDDTAMLFLMDEEGNVSSRPVLFDNVETMTDIESLSFHDGYVYALSSQSLNKKGKNKPERNLLARGRLEGGELVNSEVITLRPSLIKALSQSSDANLKSVRSELAERVEIEASFIRNGHLIAGLKDPQPEEGTALVVDLGSVEKIFSSGKIDPLELKVLFTLELGGSSKLSDMIVAGDRLLLTSTDEEEGGGALWTYEEGRGTLSQIAAYENKPEGLALSGEEGTVLVTFDEDEEAGLFTFEEI